MGASTTFEYKMQGPSILVSIFREFLVYTAALKKQNSIMINRSTGVGAAIEETRLRDQKDTE